MFNTLRFMSFHQVYYLVLRRAVPMFKLGPNISEPSVEITANTLCLTGSIQNQNPVLTNHGFTFLNSSGQSFDGNVNNIDWRSASRPKLWRYNLHYFDWLKDPCPDYDLYNKIIDHWIKHNPKGVEDAWEPYTVSLRVVNWIKYFSKLQQAGLDVAEEWKRSLYSQVMWLYGNIEYHIRANHLFKNWVALVYGFTYFDNEFCRKNLPRALDGLMAEITEQFHTDGGHYERSPMYHAICLEYLLDLFNLINAAPESAQEQFSDFRSVLQNKIFLGLRFLNVMAFPNGRFPLFGDSAFGIAPEIDQINHYAGKLGFEKTIFDVKNQPEFVHLENSKFLRINRQQYNLILTYGGPAPSYQPGHSHCDLFSYELVVNKTPIIVDTGVYDYQESKQRQYSRSTEAHNTLQINDDQQHRVWGAFRMAQRTSACITEATNQSVEVEHSGFATSKSAIRHRRLFSFLDSGFTVCDTALFSERYETESVEMLSRIHFSPECDVRRINEDYVEISFCEVNKPVLRISVGEADCKLHVKKSEYYPEFGVCKERVCLEIKKSISATSTLEYEVTVL